MKKILMVIDMQNDFITGALGTKAAEKIVPNVQAKIETYRQEKNRVVFTRDTHQKNYLTTQEGTYLPIEHCIEGTEGHQITKALDTTGWEIIDKPHFGTLDLGKKCMEDSIEEIELCGLCTDICVVSNALILKAQFPETQITVDVQCCAGVTKESHQAAILTMKMCQINVIGEK